MGHFWRGLGACLGALFQPLLPQFRRGFGVLFAGKNFIPAGSKAGENSISVRSWTRKRTAYAVPLLVVLDFGVCRSDSRFSGFLSVSRLQLSGHVSMSSDLLPVFRASVSWRLVSSWRLSMSSFAAVPCMACFEFFFTVLPMAFSGCFVAASCMAFYGLL